MTDLQTYREELDKIDNDLLNLLYKRLSIVQKIGSYKKKNNLPVLDRKREKLILENLEKKANGKVSKKLIKSIWKLIFKEAYTLEK